MLNGKSAKTFFNNRDYQKVSTIYKYADSIISPLGFSTTQTWNAMAKGACGIEYFKEEAGFPAPFWGARIPDQLISSNKALDHYTKFEKLLIWAAQEALSHTDIDPSLSEVIFIISSTKGNIDLIDPEQLHYHHSDRVFLWASAQMVSTFFMNPNRPIVVSQACISGVSALLVGMELLQQSCYKYAVVIGADVFSRFTYSGFSSLFALAPQRCKPFDINRQGLNLGEAGASIVLSNRAPEKEDECVTLRCGYAANDAHHLSAPSRTGDGLYRAISNCLLHIGYTPCFVNAHGTATPYNDQMEAVALARAGLLHLPVTACKGYLGHTLGAAGLIDVIIAARCMEESTLLPVMGFEELGVSEPICVQKRLEQKELHSCLMMISGFGGNSAALVMER